MDIRLENLLVIINKFLEKNISIDEVDQNFQTLIDSINFINMIIDIEDVYSIEIPDEYLDFQKMNTVNKIYAVIKELVVDEN